MADNDTAGPVEQRVPALTGAELRTIREGLGVTADWLATYLGVTLRTVQRWEASKVVEARTLGFPAEAMGLLEATADEHVAEHVAAFRESRATPLLTITLEDREDPRDWPAGWLRAIAWRVRREVPGLRIVDDR